MAASPLPVSSAQHPRPPSPLPAPRRWTIWNTLFLFIWVQASNSNPAKGYWLKRAGRSDAINMDVPWYRHWKKLGLWLFMEGVLIGLSADVQVVANQHLGSAAPPSAPGDGGEDPPPSCRDWNYDCHFNSELGCAARGAGQRGRGAGAGASTCARPCSLLQRCGR